MQLEVGAVVEGKVTGIVPFGAFVDVGEGKSGLVHISEISDVFVKEVSDHVEVGQNVKVKVIKMNADGKIELSMKQAMARKNPEKKFVSKKENVINKSTNFEDMMNRFKKFSEDKLSDIKRKQEGRRNRNSHKGNV
ncbi:MAG: S1 RNA-binding domain-containing protein [Acutalibacteraceae bacterium]